MSSVRKMSNNFTDFETNRRKQILLPMPPKDEKPTHSGRLLRKRWEAVKMQENVQLQIKEFELSQHALLERKEKLKEKEQQMQHRIQTNSFLKHNEEQRCDAERKARCNKELIKKKQVYLQELNEELNTLITQQQQLRKQIETNCIYAKYMDAVMQESKQFQETHELITHYETRKQIQEELLARIEKKQVEMAKSHDELARVREEYFLTRVNHETRINLLKSELEKAKQHVLNWEATWSEVQMSAKMKTYLQARINLATFNISKNLWKMGTDIPKPVKPEETIEVLDKIQEFIRDLNSIWEKVSKSESERANPYTGEQSNSGTKL
ncbi:hypothetical protein PHYPO_G00073610 [Pangasianodon hypophthalmus]|uniref:DUF4200 domain-containing protein n=1 Tax=Pangasianodon hypophthalmus TaxID=310915 RepID=A0A5N5LV22_PANHP|nr:coiled-coil domain-containing protein 42 homolog isoform X1 [Pangasianodon hypophthalmus]KAB5546568.1 hypothetical protein PHYPO_G00073610 [Pangasianodon hypophthalmus]